MSTVIRTPHGVAPAAAPEPPPAEAQLRALCGDLELMDADVAHQGAEIGRLTALLDSALRRIAALERRRRRRAP
jgi:hypothetical protein